MPKTIQIRDLDDEVYLALGRRAADAGVTIPELLRQEAERLAAPDRGRVAGADSPSAERDHGR